MYSATDDLFRFDPDLGAGFKDQRVLITGAGKDGGIGQAFALTAGLNGAASVGVHFHRSYEDGFDLVERLQNEADRKSDRVQCVSSTTGEGIDTLLAFIEERISATHETFEFTLTTAAGALDHWIHENSEVLEREFDGESNLSYRVRIPTAKKATLLSRLAKAAA